MTGEVTEYSTLDKVGRDVIAISGDVMEKQCNDHGNQLLPPGSQSQSDYYS